MTVPAGARSVATRWSMIAEAGAAERRRALAELCARYRYPVYAYLRRSGAAPARAAERTIRFLDMTQRDIGAHASPGRQFRRFLLESLEAFAARDVSRSDSVGGDAESAPLEARYQHDSTRIGTPAEAFERGFAVDVLLGAFSRLREEAEAAGHGAMYAALAPYLARDPPPERHDALARALSVRPIVIAMALLRLRQRLQEIAGEELADTVSSLADVSGEQSAMLAALGGNA